ncbi:MAG: flagellar hook-associated protein FlgK [Syntrophomonadaceae bacterium]|nr:flagellar hook-associated protein FlgK [Syntrophomonadaceae bacterium]
MSAGSFFGIEIGKRSVLTHQTALNITGHNISNANTEGYSRQVAEIVTTTPWHTPMLNNNSRIGQLGTGVDVTSINRIRDELLDVQIRNETKTSGYWNSMQETLDRVEAILNEPSEEGLRGVMDEFWESWEDLSLNPESESVRSVVIERGLAVSEAFNHTYTQLQELRTDLNEQVRIKTDEVNSMAVQITDLNKQIMAVVAAGKQPNDLQDKRDLLVKQLSEIADVTVTNEKNGMIAVQLGDRMLVQGVDYNQMDLLKDNEGMYMPVWADSQTQVKINSGSLGGLLDARGGTNLDQETEPSIYKETIPNMLEEINALAKTLIVKTNEIHLGGYSLNNQTGVPDGENFFEMPADPDTYTDWAGFMDVSQTLQDDVKNLAAASNRTWDAEGNKSNFGDGSNALQIAQLKHSLNTPQNAVKTEGLSIDFSSHDPITFIMDSGEGVKTISIAPPYTFDDMESLAEALQTEMEENDIVGEVRCEGSELVFTSATTQALELIYPNSGITDIASDGLQNGEYQIKTRVDQPGAKDASLEVLQSYNQRSASSIFGIGVLAASPTDPDLDVNASIEVTLNNINSLTGELNYSYVSHEYNMDGTYSQTNGTFTLTYGGAASQVINIGSMSAEITGLNLKSAEEVVEFKTGDKGVLGLTAATAESTTYQQIDINYEHNSVNEVSQKFIFNEAVLDPVAPAATQTSQLHFYTINSNESSNLYGESYDGYVEITNGTLATADSSNPDSSAAYFSYYKGVSEDSGMVENSTTDDYWRLVAANVGVESQEAQRMVENQDLLLGQLEEKWESNSGVSLDEEMTNMIKYQHAFTAASRFITSVDEELDVIINRMGRVGL